MSRKKDKIFIDSEIGFCDDADMATNNLLRCKMEYLKVKGVPLIVKTEKERANAFNVARDIKIEIQTRSCVGRNGFEIHRIK